MLTREETAAIPAGKELDAAIAEHVLGYIWLHNKRYGMLRPSDEADLIVEDGRSNYGKHPEGHWIGPDDKYSTDIAAAWLVVEAMEQMGGFFKLENGAGGNAKGWRAELLYRGSFYDPHLCPTAPLAICRAALLALSPAPTSAIEKEKGE